MKTVWLLVGAVLVGIGLAVGMALSDHELALGDGDEALDGAGNAGRTVPANGAPEGRRPVAVVDELEFDFGREKNHTKGHRHVFVVRNSGDYPLRILLAKASCEKCTFFKLPKNDIPPGASGEVEVSWEIESVEDHFAQSVTIQTTDPERPSIRLRITGKILQPLAVVPQELVFSGIRAGDEVATPVRLHAFFSDQLQVVRQEWQDASTAGYFDARIVSLNGDQLAPAAKSGCEVLVTVKPGLPLGRFQQKIRLTTNLDDARDVEIPIRGMIVGDVLIVGKDWDEAQGTLRLGAVNSRQGAKRTLKLLVKGPRRIGLVFEAPQASPELLKAMLGQATQSSNGLVTQVPLTIEIPPGCPPANHMGTDAGGMGEIMIATNQPGFGPLRLLVQFAVEQ